MNSVLFILAILSASRLSGPNQPWPWLRLFPSERSFPVEDDSEEEYSDKNHDAQKQWPAPQVHSLQVVTNIRYRYARTMVSSRVDNPADFSQQTTFSYVIPDTAFISGFHIDVDGEGYDAYVKEKKEATRLYDEDVQLGKSGRSVLSVRNSNRFTVSVNVESHQQITFNLTYEQLLTRQMGLYINYLTLDPGEIVEHLDVEVNIRESGRIETLNVYTPKLNPSKADSSIIKVQKRGRRAVIQTSLNPHVQRQYGKNGIKGPFVVEYDIERKEASDSQLVVNNDGYFAHYFAADHLTRLPKHVVFVLDVSLSMRGRNLQHVTNAMNIILADLRTDDYFSLVSYATDVQVWGSDSKGQSHVSVNETEWQRVVLSANRSNVNMALKIINRFRANGWANIDGALEEAIKLSKLGRSAPKKTYFNGTEEKILYPVPIIIFLTDGRPTAGVTDEDLIVRRTVQRNLNCEALIYSVALGDGADLEFLDRLSLTNCGFARKIDEAQDTALLFRNFYLQAATALLRFVSFTYEPQEIDTRTVTNRYFSSYVSGSELVVAGRRKSGIDKMKLNIGVCARGPEGQVDYETERMMAEDTPDFMERLWAYLSIQQLLDEEKKKLDADSEETKRQAVHLALQYSFVTPVTSVIVVKPDGDDVRACLYRADKGSTDRRWKNFPEDMEIRGEEESEEDVSEGSEERESNEVNSWTGAISKRHNSAFEKPGSSVSTILLLVSVHLISVFRL